MKEEDIKILEEFLKDLYTTDLNNEDIKKYFKQALENILADREKKNKIINEMALTICDNTKRLNTFWCTGCNANCIYSSVTDCIIHYFETQIEK